MSLAIDDKNREPKKEKSFVSPSGMLWASESDYLKWKKSELDKGNYVAPDDTVWESQEEYNEAMGITPDSTEKNEELQELLSYAEGGNEEAKTLASQYEHGEIGLDVVQNFLKSKHTFQSTPPKDIATIFSETVAKSKKIWDELQRRIDEGDLEAEELQDRYMRKEISLDELEVILQREKAKPSKKAAPKNTPPQEPIEQAQEEKPEVTPDTTEEEPVVVAEKKIEEREEGGKINMPEQEENVSLQDLVNQSMQQDEVERYQDLYIKSLLKRKDLLTQAIVKLQEEQQAVDDQINVIKKSS